MKNICLFAFFYLTISSLAQARPCDNAFSRVYGQGPIEEEEITAKLLCKERPSKKEQKIGLTYVCVVNGGLKSEAIEYYGKKPVTAIYTDDASAENKTTDPIVGLWYNHKGKSKENKKEDVFVNINQAGAKIIRKEFNAGSSANHTMEKINVSLIEKSLRYEKSVRKGNKWQTHEERVFDCEEVLPYEEPPPQKPKSITDSGRMDPGTVVNGTKHKTTSSGYDPKASGISGGSKK